MNTIVAVLCFTVAAQAKMPSFMDETINTPGEQYKLYKKYTDALSLPGTAKKDLHTGLNIVNKGEDIDKNDLEMFYWGNDVKYAIPKFTKLFDDKHDGKIMESELANDLAKKEIIVALKECSYLLSKGLRESCYADQLLTYGALVMDKQDAESFYNTLDKNADGKVTKKEIEEIKQDESHDVKITAEELGAYDHDDVTLDEFTEYVIQESINDDFRECRNGKPDSASGNIDFKNDCLLKQLVEYANHDLTEMDVAVLFRSVDKNGNDKITTAELKEALGSGVPDTIIERAMVTLDMCGTNSHDGDHEIDYGEFRTYMRSPTVLLQAEVECTVKYKTQKEEMDCLRHHFVEQMKDGHTKVWMDVPDLDQYITFENLDTTDDGKIIESELPFENADTKKRFMREVDSDGCRSVCLEEFNEYVDIPHMLYGMADCLMVTRKKPAERGECFTKEIDEIIDNIKYIGGPAWIDWFKYYDSTADHHIDYKDALKDKFGDEATAKLFLLELGQGGEVVSKFEFTWYVKQQELADRYEGELKMTSELKNFKGEHFEKLHPILKNYIENDVTEYDVEAFFGALDKLVEGRKDHELTESDFEAAEWQKISKLIETIDGKEADGDAGTTANYREFWLWLNSDKPGASDKKNPKVKDVFEKECTQKLKSQKDEIDCYVRIFKEGKLA